MRDEDHRGTLFGEVADDVEHFADQLRVERGRGLIKQQDLRVHGHGTGDGHALLLAAGHLAREVVHLIMQAHGREPFFRQSFGLGLRHFLRVGQAEHDVLLRRHVREQVELLEDHARHRALLRDDFFRHALALAVDIMITDLLTVEDDLTRLERLQQVDAAQQGRLARAARADDRHDLLLVHIQRDVREYREVTVAFRYVFKSQQCVTHGNYLLAFCR